MSKSQRTDVDVPYGTVPGTLPYLTLPLVNDCHSDVSPVNNSDSDSDPPLPPRYTAPYLTIASPLPCPLPQTQPHPHPTLTLSIQNQNYLFLYTFLTLPQTSLIVSCQWLVLLRVNTVLFFWRWPVVHAWTSGPYANVWNLKVFKIVEEQVK